LFQARIKAAQEKAKNIPSPPPPTADAVFGPPPIQAQAPPPAFDTSLLPPPAATNDAPPPAFDAVEDSVMMQVHQQPPSMGVAPPPTMMPSAPAFEDLLGVQSAPTPFQPVVAPPPQSVEEEMIMGLEGLSDEERRVLLEEQRQIMAQIEKEKSLNQAAIAAAQADNFDMRSTSNAVSAVGGNTRIGLSGSTAQAADPALSAMEEEDRKLALALQNEEYAVADQRTERAPRSQATTQQSTASSTESWWDTVSGIFTMSGNPSAAAKPASPQRRPPTQSTANSPEQQINFSGSRDESSDLLGSRTAGGARVAKSQPLFTCVVDSVNSTVNSLTGQSLSQDTEGNVHGVDSSSLLAVSQVGRNTEYKPL